MNTIRVLTITCCLFFIAAGVPQAYALDRDTLRIASYNSLNFPGSNVSARTPYFRTVIQTMNPDILIVQEMTSQSGVNTFLNDVMNVNQSDIYSTAPFHDGPDTDNEIFFKSSKVMLVRASYIPTALRDIAEYVLYVNGTSDTIRIYSVHLKASTGSDNEQKRFAEATILRNYLNGLTPGSQFIIVGDYNIYRSDEPAFQKLISSEADDDGRAKDPLNAVGAWNNNSAFRFIHTQSPRVRSFGGGSTGGLDDRFDIMLTSSSLDDNLIVSTYTSYGNDGNHFNDSINRLPNTAVSDSVANALHYASDHLPIFADYQFSVNGLALHPVKIQDTLFYGQSRSAIFHLTNENLSNTMNYSLTENVPWLSVSSSSGQISAGDTADVMLTVDATTLVPGSYSTSLAVVDSEHGTLLLPVDLVVEALTGVEIEQLDPLPADYILRQNYPNPFNPSTVIQYTLPARQWVSLKVYNVLGQEVATLVNQMQSAGTYNVTWENTALAGGIYFYRLQTENYTDVKRMTFIK